MKASLRRRSLVDEGLIDGVVRQSMSGKEAMVCVVRCMVGGVSDTRCAKIDKEATQCSFRQAVVDHTENRKIKNARLQRASCGWRQRAKRPQ